MPIILCFTLYFALCWFEWLLRFRLDALQKRAVETEYMQPHNSICHNEVSLLSVRWRHNSSFYTHRPQIALYCLVECEHDWREVQTTCQYNFSIEMFWKALIHIWFYGHQNVLVFATNKHKQIFQRLTNCISIAIQFVFFKKLYFAYLFKTARGPYFIRITRPITIHGYLRIS